MAEIAAGTKVFTRTRKLANLLESLEETPIDTVYLADDGETASEKQRLYDRSFDFELVVIDLPYDAGLGRGREAIVERLAEDYLLVVDSDHEVPGNVTLLADQLNARADLGGVAGTIVEPDRGRIFQHAKDFREEGDVLVRSADLEDKTVEYVAGHAFVPFDFVPNAAMFRRECLEDYCWDPAYVIEKEHVDFYVGHWKRTDWTFGITPEVLFRHYPGGDDEYEANRRSTEKKRESDEYFRKKWGYSHVRTERGYWFDTDRQSLFDRALEVYDEEGLLILVRKVLKLAPRYLRQVGAVRKRS